jgi:signal transduction histidine kinase
MRFPSAITDAVRSSLKLKLALIIVGILAVTIGIAPLGAIKMQERQLVTASEERLGAVHTMIRNTIVSSCMLSGDPASIQAVIEAVGRQNDLSLVRIFARDGTIRYSSSRDERGDRLRRAELSRYYGRTTPVVRTSNGTATHTLVRPMFNEPTCHSCHSREQKVLGVLQVSLSIEPMWKQLATLKRSAVVATVITIVAISIAVWIALTVLVDQPLHRLVEVMGRVEQGDLTVRADVRKTDELGRLARHFNDMISKQQATQQQIKQYHQEQLARADRLATIGEMAAAMAHEIRNPLTAISGVLSVLARDFRPEDPRHKVLQETHLVIGRLNKSVEDILHYSRPSAPRLQAVSLGEVVDRTFSLVEGEAKKVRVRLVREPANGIDPVVNVDPQQVQQVLVNLILNALQASAAEGEIRVRTFRREDNGTEGPACIEIEDNGKGMSPEETARAFQPFFSTKAQGTGLGLAIARQIVEGHEGAISLDSTLGKGTRVRVDFPTYRDPATDGT